MAFTSTVNTKRQFGATVILTGTYTSDGGSTGGDVETGLNRVLFFAPQPTGAAIVANQPVANETFPTSIGTITIVTTANETGVWLAIGE